MLQVRRLSAVTVSLLALLVCAKLPASEVCVHVSDYADLPLHDARVTAIDLKTGRVFNAQTGSAGSACLSSLQESLFSIEVGLAGFLNVRYYPVRVSAMASQRLQFRLPFGEVHEGGLANEALLSGTLRQREAAVSGAKICLLTLNGGAPMACATSNDLGEYALALPPGSYEVEVTVPGKPTQRSKIDIPTAGVFRNRIALTGEWGQ